MELDAFAHGERTLLRIFAAVFTAALALRLRPPSGPTTAELAAWLLVASLLIALPLFVLTYSSSFGITVGERGVVSRSAWGEHCTAWPQIARLEIGAGWLRRFERVYLVRTDGTRMPLRHLETRPDRRAQLQRAIARIEARRPISCSPGR